MMIKIVPLLFTTFFLWTCLNPHDSSVFKSFNLEDTTTINYQETIYNEQENIRMKFNSVEDSRCPYGVLCFWEGNAKVSFSITKNYFSTNYVLNTYHKFTRDTVLLGYSISLKKVMPHPHIDSTYSDSDYSADLIISKQ